MKRLMSGLVAVLAVFAVACGGDDDGGDTGGSTGGGGNSSVVIAAADADRVAHAGLPAIADLPGENWVVIGEDEFGDDSGGNEFLEMLEGTPECETLENLATLGSVFGDSGTEDDAPIGRAQIEIEQQDPDALIAPTVDVEIEIEETAAGSRAEFTIVKELFESDETSQCLVTVLNRQFSEGGPGGLEVEVTQGSSSVSAPQGGARMLFDVHMAIAGIELDMVMRMYFWPYGNAEVQAMFLGTEETLTDAFIEEVLGKIDDKLTAAAGE